MTKLETVWQKIRESLWFIPGVLALSGIVLSVVTVWIDANVLGPGRADLPWIFGGGAEGARGVLSAISGSIITVTGVVFSVTIVALQLASSQFTPRVLRNFTADRANQTVLGVFIGTFTYTLMVERTVRSESVYGPAFVPSLSVTISVALAITSIGFLIFFVDHLAQSIRASIIIDRATRETLESVDRLFPEPIGYPAHHRDAYPVVLELREGAPVVAKRSGYLQAVDEDAILEVAGEGDLVIRMKPKVGDFVMPGDVLAWVWPARELDADRRDRVREAFVLGSDRTPYQDVEFGVVELVDIAVKALSPSINDPTTATICIDRLGEVIAALGNRAVPPRFRTDAAGQLRFIAERPTYEEVVGLAFEQIRHYGCDNPLIVRRLLTTIATVASQVPAERRAPLLEEAVRIVRVAQATITRPDELASVEPAARDALAAASAEGRAAPGQAG